MTVCRRWKLVCTQHKDVVVGTSDETGVAGVAAVDKIDSAVGRTVTPGSRVVVVGVVMVLAAVVTAAVGAVESVEQLAVVAVAGVDACTNLHFVAVGAG